MKPVKCHSQISFPGHGDRFFCAHPRIFAPNFLVHATICRTCAYRNQPHPELYPSDTNGPQRTGVVGRGPCRTSSGSLERVEKEPASWKTKSAASLNKRNFLVSWNCCCDKKEATAIAFPS